MKTIITYLTLALLPLTFLRAEEETELGKQMETLNDAFKAIRKEKDPAKGSIIAEASRGSKAKILSRDSEECKNFAFSNSSHS